MRTPGVARRSGAVGAAPRGAGAAGPGLAVLPAIALDRPGLREAARRPPCRLPLDGATDFTTTCIAGKGKKKKRGGINRIIIQTIELSETRRAVAVAARPGIGPQGKERSKRWSKGLAEPQLLQGMILPGTGGEGVSPTGFQPGCSVKPSRRFPSLPCVAFPSPKAAQVICRACPGFVG